MRFENEQLAARALLGETAAVLTACKVDFAIVGGWLPFLFNGSPIPHPGTFDVDVLLRETTTKETFDGAALELIGRGFLRGAKNQFQAHRLFDVRGEQLVFHVDFLHRKYAPDVEDLVIEWGRFQSIAGPGTDLVFTENERTFESLAIVMPSGATESILVPFFTEVGLLATKGRSAESAKRTRDAFDIFLVIAQSRNRDALVRRSSELMGNGLFERSLKAIRDGFASGAWTKNAATYLSKADSSNTDPLGTVNRVLERFLQDIGLPMRAPS